MVEEAMRPDPGGHLSWFARQFGHPEFVPLEAADLQLVADASRIEEYETDAPLFREGEPAESAFLIRSGKVALWRDRRPVVNLGRVGAGNVVGDYEMLAGIEYRSTAIASEPTLVLRFEREPTLAMLSKRPVIGLRWLAASLDRLEHTQQRVAQLLRRSVKARLAALLLAEAKEDEPLELSHQSLAQLLGTNRATISRTMAELRQAGLVASERRAIQVLDREGLRRVVAA